MRLGDLEALPRSAWLVIGHSIGHSPRLLARRHSLRLALSKRKQAHVQAVQRWRDPDSNRGHHDFQARERTTRTGVDVPAFHGLLALPELLIR